MNVHVHGSYYRDTGEANDVESGLGYWSSQINHTLTDLGRVAQMLC